MINIKIDEKSLYYGLFNDYSKGQTATVSTPINQSKDPNKWHTDIIELINSGLNLAEIPQKLLDKCLTKTTAKANSKINCFFSFNNLYVDGKKIDVDCAFGLYVKEETDKFIKNRHGNLVKNTHLGRQKLHYPTTLKYNEAGLNIDNGKVLKTILNINGGFAFIVRKFEIDVSNKSLNFITSMIGRQDTCLSSVFKIKKGVGEKLITKLNDEEREILEDSQDMLYDVDLTKYHNINFLELNKIKAENGMLGEKYVFEHIKELVNEYVADVVHVSKDYSTSPYDIEYKENGIKKFIEVKATSGKRKVFNMSKSEIEFMTKYKDFYTLILVTNVKDESPTIQKLKYDDIIKLKKEYLTTRFAID